MATIPKVEKLGCHASRWRNLSTIDLNSLVIEHGADGRACGHWEHDQTLRRPATKSGHLKGGRSCLFAVRVWTFASSTDGTRVPDTVSQLRKKARLVAGDLRVQKASGTASCTGCFGRETKTNRGEKP